MKELHPTARWRIMPMCAITLALAITPRQADTLTFNDANIDTPHKDDIESSDGFTYVVVDSARGIAWGTS